MKSPRWITTATIAVAALASTACGGGGASGDGGSVFVSGSSTVEPVSVFVAELFNDEVDGSVEITVEGPGTGDGFKKFCEGETDINDASSKIRPEQIAECESAGIEFVELSIGNDGITLMTNAANDAVACLNLGDIYGLLGPESQGIDNWADANALASELGGSGDLPSIDLAINGPGEESGTYSSFVELALEDLAEERGQEADTRPDYGSSPNDKVIIQGVQGFDTSLGWVGFAFAREAQDIKVLEVDGGDGCVEPTNESIADNSYPLSRPLFIYVNKNKADESEALTAYVDYYLEIAEEAVLDEGYVPLAEADLDATRARWDDRVTGAA